MSADEANDAVMEAYAAICRKGGAICRVGPASYRRFAEMSDEMMEGLLCLLIANSEEWKTRRTADDEEQFLGRGFEESMATQLGMVARGFLRFGEEGEALCFYPSGPSATEAEEREIDRRILSSRSVLPAARIRLRRFGLLDSPERRG